MSNPGKHCEPTAFDGMCAEHGGPVENCWRKGDGNFSPTPSNPREEAGTMPSDDELLEQYIETYTSSVEVNLFALGTDADLTDAKDQLRAGLQQVFQRQLKAREANMQVEWEARPVPHTPTCEISLRWADVCDCGADVYNKNLKRAEAAQTKGEGDAA